MDSPYGPQAKNSPQDCFLNALFESETLLRKLSLPLPHLWMFYKIKNTDQSRCICIINGGSGWIRTIEVTDNRFTVCPLWPLGNSPIFNFKNWMELVDGFEPPTCWLQISCSTSWATPAFHRQRTDYSTRTLTCQALFFVFWKIYCFFCLGMI